MPVVLTEYQNSLSADRSRATTRSHRGSFSVAVGGIAMTNLQFRASSGIWSLLSRPTLRLLLSNSMILGHRRVSGCKAERLVTPLACEQLALALRPPAISRERAVLFHHSMTRNQDRERVRG